jgi:hypothetical protein
MFLIIIDYDFSVENKKVKRELFSFSLALKDSGLPTQTNLN